MNDGLVMVCWLTDGQLFRLQNHPRVLKKEGDMAWIDSTVKMWIHPKTWVYQVYDGWIESKHTFKPVEAENELA